MGDARNMKSMRLPLAAIFFMTYFYRVGGRRVAWPPRPLTGSATAQIELSIRKLGKLVKFKHFISSEKARKKSDIRVFLILVLQLGEFI